MSKTAVQTPLREALEIAATSPGVYETELPRSVCFGAVVHGGLTTSVCHRAAADFISTLPKSSRHRHALYFSINYFRPIMAAPAKTTFTFRVVQASRASTTLQVEISQNAKLCSAGMVTMADLLAPSLNSFETGWKLSPSPTPTSVSALESDTDPNWVGYLTPFSIKSGRRAQSYMNWHVPIKTQQSYHILDQWVTPGWKDDAAGPKGAVWTNELVHFAVDNVVPMINDLMQFPDPKEPGLHKRIAKAGLAQRKARSEGRNETIWGDYLDDSYMSPFIMTSSTVATEIKRLLPEEGTKWLFIRTEVKAFLNDRLDHQITLFNDKMELIAISNQLVQVIPIAGKQDKNAKL